MSDINLPPTATARYLTEGQYEDILFLCFHWLTGPGGIKDKIDQIVVFETAEDALEHINNQPNWHVSKITPSQVVMI